jgi:predicted metal-dependent hydrolase
MAAVSAGEVQGRVASYVAHAGSSCDKVTRNTGVLSFSWRLILAPPYVLNYLATHEVAHLVKLYHSPKFWRLLKRSNPDCERAKTWLDTHGTDLHRCGEPVKAKINAI